MGIDLIRGGRIANRGFRTTKSTNNYLKSLIKVTTHLLSSTPSYQEELMPNSTKLYTKDSINLDSIAIPSPSHALSSISPKIAHPLLREPTSLTELLQLLEQSPMMLDYLTSLKD